MTLRQALVRSLAEEGMKPALVRMEQRHGWQHEAAAKVRQWRAEDERNGQPWDGDVGC